MKKNNIRKISSDSLNYPDRLKQIKYPPKELYYRGGLNLLKEKYVLAVVGTRKITGYGKQVLRFLIPEIARKNIVIVSGLALGVDGLAHKLTLENGGKAVAVLAGGLDEIYPPEHALFAEEIIKSGGLLVSENCPGTEYLRQYFPARNRIISGLADVTLIIEAKRKSGALITAKFAFSQGRKVLAVPGDIFSAQSQGVNNLFNERSIPVQNPEDILNVLFGRRPAGNMGKGRRKASQNAASPQAMAGLTVEEKQILKQIPYDKPVVISQIIRNTKLPAARVVAIATQLEINSLIESADGGYLRTN